MTTSHDDLREALDHLQKALNALALEVPREVYYRHLSAVDPIVVAARCWLDLTSEQNVEKASKAGYRVYAGYGLTMPLSDIGEDWATSAIREEWLVIGRAVLEAVTGNRAP